MYRLRKISHVLDQFQELEKQEIYFAAFEELNDPMEGYRDIFWRGDKIVWKNLLINYIKSVEHFFCLALLLADTKEMNANDVLVNFSGSIRRHSPEAKQLIEEIITTVFQFSEIAALPEALAARESPVMREELRLYLNSFHRLVLHSISLVYQKKARRFTIPFAIPQTIERHYLDLLEKLPAMTNQLERENLQMERPAQRMYRVVKIVTDNVLLSLQIQREAMNRSSNYFYLLNEFTEVYLSKLETIVYPEAYIASFMKSCSNSAAWGHYGEAHTGVCLKFKTQDVDGHRLRLRTEIGASGGRDTIVKPIFGVVAHELHQISYKNEPISVDFFNSLSRLTKHEADVFWYTDEKGNRSECGMDLQNKKEDWHDKYWDTFHRGLLSKSAAWSYEEESRVILQGNFIDYSQKASRKLTYDFSDLEGIIFGIKTKAADKARIVKIIKEKCEKNGRTEFDFYQADYSSWTDQVEMYKVDL